MSLEEFEENFDPRRKQYRGMKSVMDIGMGIIMLGVALFILFAGKLNMHNEFIDSIQGKVFAWMIIVYGSWRIYRGIKKDYFRES